MKILRVERRNIGFIFQSFQLVSELNVEQNIIFPLLLDYQKPDPKKVNEILNLLGLTERRHHLPGQLSGGQQQRVAIGRFLITHNNNLTASVDRVLRVSDGILTDLGGTVNETLS